MLLKQLLPHKAKIEDFAAYHAFIRLLNAEEYPDDPPKSLEFTIKALKSRADLKGFDCQTWVMQRDKCVLARLNVDIEKRESNRHVMFISLHTHPHYRKQGLGKALLHKVLELADAHKRSLIIAVTTDRSPAGDSVAAHLGATKGIEMHTNQLRLSELDAGLIEQWLSAANILSSQYELGCWRNSYPENDIEKIAKLMEVMNTAPRENLKVEDHKITPDYLHEMVKLDAARGTQVWTIYVRHRVSGEFAGYSETFWHPENPQVLWQGATGVLPRYRGHGLGKWLKAAMLQKTKRERPSVTYIRTGNADSNAPMLAINQKLGFKPYSKETIWQLETEMLRKYLT